MSVDRIKYVAVRAARFTAALITLTVLSPLMKKLLYAMADKVFSNVTENTLFAFHILLCYLAYNSVMRAVIITDAKARGEYFSDGKPQKLSDFIKSDIFTVSVAVSTVFFVVFPDSFALNAICGIVDSLLVAYIISFIVMIAVLFAVWVFMLKDWRKTEDILQKSKRTRNENRILMRHALSILFSYPVMAYILPAVFPAVESIPRILIVVVPVLIPSAIVIIAMLFGVTFLRAFIIRVKFINKLRKSAIKNGYIVSEIKRPYLSVITDDGESSFTVKANGKTYTCKLLSGIIYSNPMYLGEDGKGTIINRIRFRIFLYGARGLGKIGWHNTDELARFETNFTYSFDGEGKKVLVVCPTPHTIFATGQGENRLLDVSDNIWGYTLMTGTAFINALERDAI
ncbi:MAG: hypothetical protein IKU61_01735 [Clostridia bacterium]|nr:hypothetical protein [Clostridia bacterium]